MSGISELNGTKNQVWFELTVENTVKILQLFTKNYTNILQTASPFQRIPPYLKDSICLILISQSIKDSINIYGRTGKEILSVEDGQATKIWQMLGKHHVANALLTDKRNTMEELGVV